MKAKLLLLFLIVVMMWWTNSAVAATLNVHLTWTDAATNEVSYHVERKVGTGAYAEVTQLGVNAVAYDDNGLTVGQSYCWRSKARNQFGDSGYTNEFCTSAFTPANPSGMQGTVVIVP